MPFMKRTLFHLFIWSMLLVPVCATAQSDTLIRKKDRKKDIKLTTTMGVMVLRLSDSTPLHRDNFIRLVKSGYYDSTLFHRGIKNFMIQGGDPDSKNAKSGQPLGMGGPSQRIPAEFRASLFHKKGVLAAARDNNPEKASSGSQFYIVQGKVFSDAGLDSLETYRLQGRKIPADQRETYKTVGGTPHLDQNYTVFGQLIRGFEVLDAIAGTPTSRGPDRDRPITDCRILKAELIKRRK